MEAIINSEIAQEISTGTVNISYDGLIVRIVVKEDADFSYENSFRDRLVLQEILGDKKALVLIDAQANFFISSEGMDLAASEEGLVNRKAIAYFTNNFGSKLKLKVFLSSKKPKVPCKIFDSEKEAVNWLLSLEPNLS